MPQTCTSEKRDNLDKYNKFINELLVQIKGGWSPVDTLPYDEDLLRFMLGLSPRAKINKEFYSESDQVLKRNRLGIQPNSDKTTESTRGQLLLQKDNHSLQIKERSNNS